MGSWFGSRTVTGGGAGSAGGRWSGRRKRQAAAGAVIAVGAVLAGTIAASASGPPLPEISPARLLAKGLAAKPPGPMTAVVDETANLGFPALPDIPGMSASSPFNAASLIAGTHEFDIWYGGPKQVRIAMPVKFGETDLRVNGSQVWLWQSSGQTATKILLPAPKAGGGAAPGGRPTGGQDPVAGLTPSAVAGKILALAGPSTIVKGAPSTTIANHDAYQLLIEPRSDKSLIGQVLIAFDASTMLPLRVVVTPRGSTTTAFEVTYAKLSYGAPDASNFSFTPPPGAKVKTYTPGVPGTAASPALPGVRVPQVGSIVVRPSQASGAAAGPGPAGKPAVIGKGWLSVVALPAGSAASPGSPGSLPGGAGGLAGQAGSLIATMLKSATPESGSWGSGKLLSTTLFNVLITDKGQVLIGAVTPDVLYGDVGQAP